jgi:hypothetical protein
VGFHEYRLKLKSIIFCVCNALEYLVYLAMWLLGPHFVMFDAGGTQNLAGKEERIFLSPSPVFLP